MAKLDPLSEACARLSMLQFAMEALTANLLAGSPPEVSAQFKSEFLKWSNRVDLDSLSSSGAATHEQEQREAAFAQRTAEMAKHFMQKVEEREAHIRSVG